MTTTRPVPVADLHTEPYWQGLRRKVLLVQACAKCSLRIHPSLPCCPNCLATDLEWVEVSGAGTVVSYCVVAQPFVAGMALPYVVVRVSLRDAPEVALIANLTGDENFGVTIGALVDVVFEEIDDDVVLANFTLVANE